MSPLIAKQLLGAIDFVIPEEKRVRPDGSPRDKELFNYSAPFNGVDVLPAGQSVSVGITFDADSDFVGLILNIVATLVDDVTFIAQLPATILLTTTGGGNRKFDQPIHVETLRGSGELPGVLQWPLWLPQASQLNITLNNLDLVNAFNVWLTLGGVKIF